MRALIQRYRSWAAGHPWSLPFAWYVLLTLALTILVPDFGLLPWATVVGIVTGAYLLIRIGIRRQQIPIPRREGESDEEWARRKRKANSIFGRGMPVKRVRASAPPPTSGGRPYPVEGDRLNLSYEREIVWLVDPSYFRYVLEEVQPQLVPWPNIPDSHFPSRYNTPNRVVAYIEYRTDLPPGTPSLRDQRFWTVEADHPHEYPPANAVDPASIRPGQYSRVVQ